MMKRSDEPISILINRPRMLIMLLSNLERLFFNAYDGCAIALPPANKTVRTFFINNRKICEQERSKKVELSRNSTNCVSLNHSSLMYHS